MADKGKGIADDYSSGKRKREGDDKSGYRKRETLNALQLFEDSAVEIQEISSSDDEDFINDDLGGDIDPNNILKEHGKPVCSFAKNSKVQIKAESMDERDTDMSCMKDPTIWKVKCTVGSESHSAESLTKKHVDLQSSGAKLQIVSAFAVEHVTGFIYIEAENQLDIYEACKGLPCIIPSQVELVPVTEVPDLFIVRSKSREISVGSWARVKRGTYRGDLAQVVTVNVQRKKVTVKLVPRIDLQAVAEKSVGGVTGKKSTTPAPRLITSSELEAYRPLFQYRRDRETGDVYEVFDNKTLKDGYLYKKVPLESLSFLDGMPPEAELIKFMPANKDKSNAEHNTKKQTMNHDKLGGKGEGGSNSGMENSFEIADLVFHGHKAFGVVIGKEKDDRIKVLEEGSEGPVVVAVDVRLLKKATIDKNSNTLDLQKKIISVNDTVRVLEGPLEFVTLLQR